MKLKTILALTVFCVSTSAMAVPLSSDKLITGLVTSNVEFRALLEKNTSSDDNPFQSNFESLSVDRVSLTDELRERCNANSRSGAAVQVTLSGNDAESGEETVQTFVFTTPRAAEDLKLCENEEE